MNQEYEMFTERLRKQTDMRLSDFLCHLYELDEQGMDMNVLINATYAVLTDRLGEKWDKQIEDLDLQNEWRG